MTVAHLPPLIKSTLSVTSLQVGTNRAITHCPGWPQQASASRLESTIIRWTEVNEETMHILFPLIGYLVGAIPFGLVIGKMVGVDVRTQGSRNIGATNVNRVLGKKLGVMTLACDMLKGFLPMYLCAALLPDSATKELVVALTGVMAVIGHMFSIYLGFRGGKGVATGLGVFLYISPAAIGISLVIFLATVLFSGFVSAGSLLASGLIPLWLYLLGASKTATGAAAAVALLIWIKHHENIHRLLHGKEKSWKKGKLV